MKSLSLLLIFLQLTPVYGSQSTVGIVRVGDFSGTKPAQLAQIEKGIQRSIENSNAAKAKVMSAGHVLLEREYKEFTELLELKRLNRKIKEPNFSERDRTTVHSLRAKFEKLGRYGSEVQGLYFSEAYSYWMSGQKSKAESLLSKALRLHPEGEGDFLGDWSEAESADNQTLAFSLLIESKRAKVVRGCNISFSNLEKDGRPYVNGFWLSPKTQYNLQAGQVYRLSRGPTFESSLITCGHAKMRVSLSSNTEDNYDFASLEKNYSMILFLREAGQKIHLDSYSKSGGYFSDFLTLDSTLAGKYAMPEEKIRELARIYQLNNLDLAMNPSFRPNPQPAVSSVEGELDTPWFKSWVFWTITGVVAAGTTTYLLTRNSGGSSVGTNVNGIKISLE